MVARYKTKWKGVNINCFGDDGGILNSPPPLPHPKAPLAPSPYVYEIELHTSRFGKTQYSRKELRYKDLFPPGTPIFYNYQEMALCAAMRIYLKTNVLFYTLEAFDYMFLYGQRYRCSLRELDEKLMIYKSIVLFLSGYLEKYTYDVVDVVRFACRALNIPPYHVIKQISNFDKRGVKEACRKLSATCSFPKVNEKLRESNPALHQAYSNRCHLFLLMILFA